MAEYKILYGINVASQAADDHVQCVLQRTLTPYKKLYSARRMPRKLTEQLVGAKEAADVARYSAYVRGRLHIFQQDSAPAHRARDNIELL